MKRRDGRRVTTPVMLQMQANECGAAALGIVLGFHGRIVALEELRLACGVSRDGARMSGITRGAARFGLEAKGFQCPAEAALETPVPFIAFWNNNHFLVIEGASGRRVFLNDPALGRYSIGRGEFDERYSGRLIELRRGPAFHAGGRRPSVARAAWAWTEGTRGALLAAAVASLLLALPAFLLAATTKTFIDQVLIRQAAIWVLPIAAFLLMVIGGVGLLTWLQQNVLLRLRTGFAISLTSWFAWHVLRLPSLFYAQRYAGDLAARLQSCLSLAGTLSGPLPTTLAQAVVGVSHALILGFISPWLTACVIGLTLLNTVVVAAFRAPIGALSNVRLNRAARASGAAMAGLRAIETLKATGAEGSFFQTWRGFQTEALTADQAVGRLSLWMRVLPDTITHATQAVVMGVGALLVIDGRLSIGGLVAYQMLLANFQGPIAQAVGLSTTIQEARGHMARLDDVLGQAPDPLLAAPDPDAAIAITAAEGPVVCLEDVCFRYGPSGGWLLDGISFTVAAGEHVAIVGGSGSGKSTLARLIVGLYPPVSGRIRHFGRSIGEIPRSVFTGRVAAVDQDIALFEGTVFDNLTLWDASIPRDQVIRAARDADIHETIAALPLGYETPAREGGVNFSGGQRQRLELARALARDPALLVLDEATAALDPITEARITRNLRRRGVTFIVVAHRLSSVRDCDTIIVLDRGRIVETGRHGVLLARRGAYAALVAAA